MFNEVKYGQPMLSQWSGGSSGFRMFIDSRSLPSAQLDCARRCVGGDAEVPALPGSIRRAIYGLWHINGGSQVRVVVSRNLLRCGFALSGGNDRARILQVWVNYFR